MRQQVLIIEDAAVENGLLRDAVRGAGYLVHRVEPDRWLPCDHAPDIIVIVAETGAVQVASLCRGIRAAETDIPILVVAAESNVAVEALRAGADDCVGGQVEPIEVLARVEALLRRSRRRQPNAILRFGTLEVDVQKRRAIGEGYTVGLAPKEMNLLWYLAKHAGEVVSREELLHELWGSATVDARTVDMHVASLRRKIERDPRRPAHLVTVRGHGYQFLF